MVHLAFPNNPFSSKFRRAAPKHRFKIGLTGNILQPRWFSWSSLLLPLSSYLQGLCSDPVGGDFTFFDKLKSFVTSRTIYILLLVPSFQATMKLDLRYMGLKKRSHLRLLLAFNL